MNDESEHKPIRFLADFRLRTVLRVTPKDARISRDVGERTFLVSNSKDPDSRDDLLDVKVILLAVDIASAEMLAAEEVENFANLLAFTTGAAVRVVRPVYLIDWEPGHAQRDQYVYLKQTLNDPVDALDEEMLATVAQFNQATLPPPSRSALRWYARGLRARVLEDQFQYLWFAIEILAVATKAAGKVVDKCPRCRQDLVCTNCGQPEHRPFEKQKISLLLERLGLSSPLVSGLFEVRNLLMHGEERETIVSSLKSKWPDFELEKAVQIIQRCASKALLQAFEFGEGGRSVKLYHVESAMNVTVTAKAVLRIGLNGDHHDPRVDDVWVATVELVEADPATGKMNPVPHRPTVVD